MDNALIYNAMMAWTALGIQDYSTLEQHDNAYCSYLY